MQTGTEESRDQRAEADGEGSISPLSSIGSVRPLDCKTDEPTALARNLRGRVMCFGGDTAYERVVQIPPPPPPPSLSPSPSMARGATSQRPRLR